MIHADSYSGAVWAGLVPTVIALAIYFCIADFVLISQCLYYNQVNARREAHRHAATLTQSEEAPLLARQRSDDSIGLPGSHRRNSARHSHSSEARRDSLAKILEDVDSPTGSSWTRNIFSIIMVILVGAAGWAIAWQSGVWNPTPERPGDLPDQQHVAVGASVLGYFSAVCYLG